MSCISKISKYILFLCFVTFIQAAQNTVLVPENIDDLPDYFVHIYSDILFHLPEPMAFLNKNEMNLFSEYSYVSNQLCDKDSWPLPCLYESQGGKFVACIHRFSCEKTRYYKGSLRRGFVQYSDAIKSGWTPLEGSKFVLIRRATDLINEKLLSDLVQYFGIEEDVTVSAMGLRGSDSGKIRVDMSERGRERFL